MAITTMITTIVVAAMVASVLRTWLHARVALRSSAAAADVAGRPSLLDVALAGIAAVRAELAKRAVVAPVVLDAATGPTWSTTLAASVVDAPMTAAVTPAAPAVDSPATDAAAAANRAAAGAFERVPLATTSG